MEINGNNFIKEEKNFEYSFYIIQGENTYLIDKIFENVKEKIKKEGYDDFSVKIFSAKQSSLQNLIDGANTLPFFGGKQFFFVRDIEENKNFSKETNKQIEAFFKNKHPFTTFFFFCKGNDLDRRSKFFKIIEDAGLVINCNNPNDKELSSIIKDYVSKNNFTITTNAIYLVKTMTGGDIRLIHTELDKIFLNKNIEKIDEKVVEKYLSDNRKYNFFQIQESIINREHALTFQIIENLLLQEKIAGLILILSILHNFFAKILVVHQMKNKTAAEISEAIQIPIYFLDKYETATKHFSIKRIIKIMEKIIDVDLAAKGITPTNFNYEDLGMDLIMAITMPE